MKTKKSKGKKQYTKSNLKLFKELIKISGKAKIPFHDIFSNVLVTEGVSPISELIDMGYVYEDKEGDNLFLVKENIQLKVYPNCIVAFLGEK